jgi:hypothetical protein
MALVKKKGKGATKESRSEPPPTEGDAAEAPPPGSSGEPKFRMEPSRKTFGKRWRRPDGRRTPPPAWEEDEAPNAEREVEDLQDQVLEAQRRTEWQDSTTRKEIDQEARRREEEYLQRRADANRKARELKKLLEDLNARRTPGESSEKGSREPPRSPNLDHTETPPKRGGVHNPKSPLAPTL